MDTLSIPGPPCPLCGERAFAWSKPACDADDLLVEIGDAHYRPRVCAECGNLQLVLIRVEKVTLRE
jgi:hypothetical protein